MTQRCYLRLQLLKNKMPRYQYHCSLCESEFTVVHAINERLEKCQTCKKVGSLKKVYTTIRKMKNNKKSEKQPGKIVKNFIEDTKKEVNKEKKKMKSEEYKP